MTDGYSKFNETIHPWLVPTIERMKDLEVGRTIVLKLESDEQRQKTRSLLYQWLAWSGSKPYFMIKQNNKEKTLRIIRLEPYPKLVVVEEESTQADKFPPLEDTTIDKIFEGSLDLQTGGDDDMEKTVAYFREQVEEHGLNSQQIQALTKRVEDFYKISLA